MPSLFPCSELEVKPGEGRELLQNEVGYQKMSKVFSTLQDALAALHQNHSRKPPCCFTAVRQGEEGRTSPHGPLSLAGSQSLGRTWPRASQPLRGGVRTRRRLAVTRRWAGASLSCGRGAGGYDPPEGGPGVACRAGGPAGISSSETSFHLRF